MKPIDFERKARELIQEIARVNKDVFRTKADLWWHGIDGNAVTIPTRALDITDPKEMQSILELAWAQHCLENGA